MSTDFVFSLIAICVAIVVFGLLITGAVLVVRDTIRKRGWWGISIGPVNCRNCNAQMPAVRAPTSFRQAMWGGWACAECGLELDKWGEPTAEQAFPAKWSARLNDDRPSAKRRADSRTQRRRDDMHRGDDRVY
jgi:hypothetical protein